MCKHRSNNRKKHGKTVTQRKRALKKVQHKVLIKRASGCLGKTLESIGILYIVMLQD